MYAQNAVLIGWTLMNDSDKRPTILIVEDVDWIRTGMKEAVEREGYCAFEATNDTDALEIAAGKSIELILTEEEVPTFDLLMSRLREDPELSKVPVVIVNPDAEEGARYGDAYLLADYSELSTTWRPLQRS